MILKLFKGREGVKTNRNLTSKLILLAISLFLLFSSFTQTTEAATESIKTIREDGTGDYTSLSAWEAGEQRDLTATDEIAVARIEGTWTNPDTTAVTIDGWTTDATRYIRIYTAPEARHTGKWDTGRYMLQAGGNTLNIQEQYTRIDGLQVYQTNSGNWNNGAINVNVAKPYVQISNNIVKSALANNVSLNGGGALILIQYFNNTSNINKIWNNILYDKPGTYGIGINAYGYNEITYIYNNTITGSAVGIYVYTGIYEVVVAKNNLVYNNTDNYNGTFNVASTNNLSGHSQADAPGSNSKNSTTVFFVDSTSKDFHLVSGDTGAKDSGTDLSGDANLAFSTDIDGETRSGTWDIGADETSGGTPPPSYQCSDGLDNDGNGLTDYPSDSGCTSTTDNDEYNAPTDITPPTRSTGSPTGTLTSGTTSTTLSITTDENATCKYGVNSNTAYASIPNTFSITGGTSHTTTLTGLTGGTSYTYYIRCQDTAGNPNTSDYPITFSVASAPTTGTPSVSGVSGAFTNDSAITITGSSFGSNGPNIVVFDDFEGGTNGSVVSTGANSATVGKWDRVGGGDNNNPPVYDNIFSVSGSRAMKSDYTVKTNTGTDSNSAAFVDGIDTGDVFLSYWYYLPTTSSFPCYNRGICNWKVAWLYGADTRYDDQVLPVGLPGGTTPPYSSWAVSCNDCFGGTANWYTLNMAKGKWYRVSAWVHATPDSSSEKTLWVVSTDDAIPVTQKVNWTGQIFKDIGDVFKTFSFSSWARWCNDCAESAPRFDDVYMATGSNARARVEIGNASTYSASTNLSIATVTSWSDSSIAATVRQGSFTPGQTAYLYVIDANGNVSAGKQITIGGTSVPLTDITAPTTTTSLLGGTYNGAQTVTLSTNETATTYYTIDGSTPTISLTVYSSAISIPQTTTLKYFSVDTAGNTEGVKTQTYTINTSTKFSLNNRVQTTSTLNVRQTPSATGTLLGTEAQGNLGTVTGGPTYADSFWWWQVQYDSGLTGWSVEDYLTLYSAPTSGTPSVSGVSGAFTNDSAITITGSSFGANGPNIVVFDDFERGTNGSVVATGANSATIGKWDRVGGGDNSNPPKYDNTYSVSGNMAFKGDATKQTNPGSSDSTSAAFIDNLNSSDVYLSYWVYWPTTSSFPCKDGGICNIKYAWFYDTTTLNDRTMFSSMPSSNSTVSSIYFFGNGSATGEHYFSPSVSMQKGKWYRLSGWIHGASDSSGRENAWIMSPSDQANIAVSQRVGYSGPVLNPGGLFKHFSFNAYERWCNDCAESAPRFDDVYLATGPNARARVEIGNASTYNASTNLAIATVTSWSDSSITATVRQGSFTPGQTAYLYVIDANGNVSAGKQITIGGTSAPPTLGDPVVSGVSSTFNHGSSVTLTGSNFGLKASATPMVWENFEWGVNGDEITGKNGWIESNAATQPNTSINTAQAYGAGSRSSYYMVDPPEGSQASETQEFGFIKKTFPESDQVYVSYLTRIDQTVASGSRMWKIGRIGNWSTVPSYNQPPYMGVTWFPTEWNSHYDVGNGQTGVYDGGGYATNTWHRVEMWIKLSSPADTANGELEYWLNYAQKNPKNVTVTRTATIANEKIDTFTSPHMYVNAVGGKYEIWMDDVYIDNTKSRTELCNSSTWATRIQCEIQIPSAWSPNSITLTANQGAFTPGQTVYLYVIDASGKVNASGYPVTIGGISTPTYQCSDGTDNDSDGFTDYPSDPGCTSTTDNNEYNPPADTTAPVLTAITATSIGPNSATISWATNEPSDTQVEYGLSTSYGTATNLNSNLTTTHSQTLNNLSPSTLYHYRVRSVDASGNNSISTDQTFTTSGVPDTTPPSAITNLSTSFINHTSITLNWTAPGDDGTQGATRSYDIRYSTSPIDDTNFSSTTQVTGEPTPKVSGTSESYPIAGLSSATTYYFALKTTDDAGNVSPLSNIASDTTHSLTLSVNLSANKTSGNPPLSINLTASSAGDTLGQTTYTFYCNREDTGTNITTDYNTQGPLETHTCTYPTVGSYTAKVIAQRGTISSENRVSINVTSPTTTGNTTTVTSGGGGGGGSYGGGGNYYDTTPPAVPQAFTAQSAENQATLTWTNPPDSDFVRVAVVRSLTPISNLSTFTQAQTQGEVIYEGTDNEYTDINLSNNTPYYYAIYSYDKKPNYSNPIIVTATPKLGQTSISTQTTPTSLPIFTPTITTLPPLEGPFSIGMENNQVKLLQQYLAQDKEIYPEGITSGYYGALTQRAVERFQKKYNIISSGSPYTTGYGLAGPGTRAKIMAVLGATLSTYGGGVSTLPGQTIPTSEDALKALLMKQIEELQAILQDLLAQLVEALMLQLQGMAR
ncbi:MAG: chitobiase/beta-hexosaminidase C-terminal domain-containing protein [Parcubacteria group bacterium]|nr:chitobiase/beta-hexosaminidase C-terminal domain-containing protein [Parcubacteria group bacterium]MCR4342624.1 chitobiase/beta-hexosaminidase C-terminal domain-containing protein [Patescibacteria group bacterium]